MKSLKQSVASIVEAIKKFDTTFQNSLNQIFAEKLANTFKALRRALPVTKSKIEWPAILAYKIGGQMGEK